MIKGKKIILRPIKESDLDLLYRWINNPAITSFWYGNDKPRSMMWVKNHFIPIIEGKTNCSCWAIEVEDKPIGFMYNTIYTDDDKKFSGRVELDILIGEDGYRGRGYGTDALKTMVSYAFNYQKAERVFLTPHHNNQQAIHVYEKAGFKKEGILRHYEMFEGKYINCLMMSIIRKDFKGRQHV